ncbi:MAG TPA: serine hydrolase domain-containing protein [Vicinamibacteria bacterium]|nr:serine hydrolase domain-containing protein [Vicinamibacteria bacterium]
MSISGTRFTTLPAIAWAVAAVVVSASGFGAIVWREAFSPWLVGGLLALVATLSTLAAARLWRMRRLAFAWLACALACAVLASLALVVDLGLLVAVRRLATAPLDPRTVQGTVEPGFEEVAEAFRDNFTRRGELGAACAIYLRGRKVVDLWGGYRDLAQRDPWTRDTMVAVFSSTKGMAATAVAVAHSRGLIDYDEKVASYWPEFADAGKADITVRQLLAHQAGLACLDERVSLDTLKDPDRLAGVLARQRPLWPPGSRHGYHGVTVGLYEGELVRRVDPLHRSLGQFFHHEVARPLQIEFYVGLPRDIPSRRMARLEFYDLSATLLRPQEITWGFLAAMRQPSSLTTRMFTNPSLAGLFPDYARDELRGIEIPSVNGVGEARALARAYAELAGGAPTLRLAPRTLAALAAPAQAPSGGSFDLVLLDTTSFSLGFMKPDESFRFGASDTAFGSPGMGGSFGYADPDRQVGYAYTPNRLGYNIRDDPRDAALRRALDRCLRRGAR